MQRGQASVEIGIAVLLLSALIAAAWLAGTGIWLQNSLTVANVAADRALRDGSDPLSAARAAVPALLADQVERALNSRAFKAGQ